MLFQLPDSSSRVYVPAARWMVSGSGSGESSTLTGPLRRAHGTLPTLETEFYEQTGLARLFPRSRRFGREPHRGSRASYTEDRGLPSVSVRCQGDYRLGWMEASGRSADCQLRAVRLEPLP